MLGFCFVFKQSLVLWSQNLNERGKQRFPILPHSPIAEISSTGLLKRGDLYTDLQSQKVRGGVFCSQEEVSWVRFKGWGSTHLPHPQAQGLGPQAP